MKFYTEEHEGSVAIVSHFQADCHGLTTALQAAISLMLQDCCDHMPGLAGGFQAVVEVAFNATINDLVQREEVLPPDQAFFDLCQECSQITVIHQHYSYGQAGSFALVKNHTLRRNPGMVATGNWTMGELVEQINEIGEQTFADSALAHLHSLQRKGISEISQLLKADHALIRDYCDLTALPGAFRVPFRQIDNSVSGEIRISFSGLTSEQDVMMAVLVNDAACAALVDYGSFTCFRYTEDDQLIGCESGNVGFEIDLEALHRDKLAGFASAYAETVLSHS